MIHSVHWSSYTMWYHYIQRALGSCQECTCWKGSSTLLSWVKPMTTSNAASQFCASCFPCAELSDSMLVCLAQQKGQDMVV